MKITKNKSINLQKTLDRVAKLLYGFYCAGVARGLQPVSHISMTELPAKMEPREAWAFAYGLRYANNPLLTIDLFKRDMRVHFKQ